MANRWKGNIIAATATTSSGTDYTGKANGAWGLNSQLQQKQSGLWAKGVSVPSAPTIGTASGSDSSATITFTAPSDTGGQAISSYIATSNPSGITGTSTSSPITVTGLTNGTSYTFTVAAINPSGTGAQSASSNAVTPSGITVPGAPTIGTATLSAGTGVTSAVITFTPPSNTGGSPITGYTVKSSPGNITATGTGSPITITGLATGTTYTFTVQATNAIGTGSASASSNSIMTAPAIGQSYAGGYVGGKINDGGVNYFLIVAPKATGQVSGTVAWGINGVTTGATSASNGKTNTDTLAALGSAYAAAYFCKNLTIGGFTDWYLPARYEQNIIYYWLKPSIFNNSLNVYAAPNDIVPGVNPNAVFPMPINTAFTASDPTQTTVGLFKDGTGAEAYDIDYEYWESTQVTSNTARGEAFINCHWNRISQYFTKADSLRARAIRRIVAW